MIATPHAELRTEIALSVPKQRFAPQISCSIPLVVDRDGTLRLTSTLHESFVGILFRFVDLGLPGAHEGFWNHAAGKHHLSGQHNFAPTFLGPMGFGYQPAVPASFYVILAAVMVGIMRIWPLSHRAGLDDYLLRDLSTWSQASGSSREDIGDLEFPLFSFSPGSAPDSLRRFH